MKKCEEFAPLLSAFVDGELTEEERAEVLAHVSECEKCRRLLGELTALHAALGELEDEDVPAGFTGGVMAAVRAEKAAAKIYNNLDHRTDHRICIIFREKNLIKIICRLFPSNPWWIDRGNGIWCPCRIILWNFTSECHSSICTSCYGRWKWSRSSSNVRDL